MIVCDQPSLDRALSGCFLGRFSFVVVSGVIGAGENEDENNDDGDGDGSDHDNEA